jgi:serine/threonine protein kinase
MRMPEPGEDFADYRIEGVIGRGGMGVVYLAFHRVTERRVALKLLPADLAVDQEYRSRFQRELRAAAQIEDPHVVPIHTFGEHQGQLFLEMRFVQGADLDTLIRREGPFEPRRAVRLVGQVAAALDKAHELGLVHRDVKPANILIERRAGMGSLGDRVVETAFLTDFGLARRGEGADALTSAGQVVGSYEYIAPEQIENRRLDARTDVYALACVLYRMLTGEPPYTAGNAYALLYAHLHSPVPSARELATAVGPELDRVVAVAMSKEPAQRHASAGDFAREAELAVEEDGERVELRRRPLVAAPIWPSHGGPVPDTATGYPTSVPAGTAPPYTAAPSHGPTVGPAPTGPPSLPSVPSVPPGDAATRIPSVTGRPGPPPGPAVPTGPPPGVGGPGWGPPPPGPRVPGRRRWLVAGAAGAAVLLLVVLVAVLAGGGNGGTAGPGTPPPTSAPPSTPPTPTPTTSTSSPPVPSGFTALEATLWAKVPPAVRGSCRPYKQDEGVRTPAVLICDTPGVGADLVFYYGYADVDALEQDFQEFIDTNKLPSGTCPGEAYQPHRRGEAGGNLACRKEDGSAVYAYNERSTLVGVQAANLGGDMDALHRWWTETPLPANP